MEDGWKRTNANLSNFVKLFNTVYSNILNFVKAKV